MAISKFSVQFKLVLPCLRITSCCKRSTKISYDCSQQSVVAAKNPRRNILASAALKNCSTATTHRKFKVSPQPRKTVLCKCTLTKRARQTKVHALTGTWYRSRTASREGKPCLFCTIRRRKSHSPKKISKFFF